MPITIEYRHQEHIAIAAMIGNLSAGEIDNTLRGELGQFIQMRLPHKLAPWRNPGIIIRRQLRSGLFRIYPHAPEFIDKKRLLPFADALLFKKHG